MKGWKGTCRLLTVKFVDGMQVGVGTLVSAATLHDPQVFAIRVRVYTGYDSHGPVSR